MNRTTLVFIIGVLTLTLISFLFDKKKTIKGIKKGAKMLLGILPAFLNILIIISIVLYIIPQSLILKLLGPTSGALGLLLAALIGAITLVPGPVSYPLAAALIKQGASYTVIATLMTTLMMVGVVTLPLEIKYFGKKVAILRNSLNFIAAVLIGLAVGLIMNIIL